MTSTTTSESVQERIARMRAAAAAPAVANHEAGQHDQVEPAGPAHRRAASAPAPAAPPAPARLSRAQRFGPPPKRDRRGEPGPVPVREHASPVQAAESAWDAGLPLDDLVHEAEQDLHEDYPRALASNSDEAPARPAGHAGKPSSTPARVAGPAGVVTQPQPESPGQRARRLAHTAQQRQTQPEQVQLPQQEGSPTAWDDPSRPHGSVYSAQEWEDVQRQFPQHVVFEMHKPHERGLVAVDEQKLGPVLAAALRRSLLVTQSLAQESGLADVPHAVVHQKDPELGMFSYVLIFSQQQLECADARRLMLGPGITLRMGHTEESLQQERNTFRSRAQRYGG